MAALMAAPMIIIEIAVMSPMYQNRNANRSIIALSIVVLAASLYFIRYQVAVGDVQLLRSMIPHHAGEALMCREASTTDGRVKQLCDSIIKSRLDEISRMKGLLGQTYR